MDAKHVEEKNHDATLRSVEVDENTIDKLHNEIEKQLQEQGFIFDKKHFIVHESNNSVGAKFADNIAKFGGSWAFVLSFLAFMGFWISMNIYFLANEGFDPYPFILLNLMLSCIAALQAPVIMMSQNRQAERERKQQEINLEKDIVDFKQDRLDLILDQKEWALLLRMDARLRKIEAQLAKKKRKR